MVSQAAAATTLIVVVSILVTIIWHLGSSPYTGSLQIENKPNDLDLTSSSLEGSMLSKSLASAFSGNGIFPHDTVAFKQSMNSY
jgi:hypothetical protein